MKLILLRHGESQWNLENRFTGWKDVGLTKKGIKEAEFAAQQLINAKIQVNTISTSLLKRATHSAEIVSDLINFNKANIQYNWRLNERHYGALQGLNKSETADKYGEKQVHIWRRSYDIPPPKLSKDDINHPKFNKKFSKIDDELPSGESLKDVILRLNPFWKSYTNYIRKNNGNHLIVAHSNSLRAIIKILDNMSAKEIMDINIPTGVPLVYKLEDTLQVIKREYLIDKNELEKRNTKIIEQGKKNG